MTANERILVYRLASMGDTVISLPCFYTIRRRYPTAQIALLTSKSPDARVVSAATLLEGTGLVDHYITYPNKTRDISQLWEVKRAIQSFAPSLLIYLTEARHSFLATYRDYLFFRWCGIRCIVGVPFTRDLRSRRPPQSGGDLWESEANRLARCMAAIGVPDLSCRKSWSLRLSEQESAMARQLLIPGTRLLGLAIGARVAAKDWGIENWRKVLAGVADSTLALVLIGAEGDREHCDDVASNWPGPIINLCGKTVPRMSAAVIQHLDLLLCHDGGPMHLAAAVGTPCIAVFSSVNRPGEWFPFGANHRVFHPGLTGLIRTATVIDAAQAAMAAWEFKRSGCASLCSAN